MIIHLCLYKGLLSCIILAFTSSIDKWSAARVILAIALFSLLATFSSQNYTTERRLVLGLRHLRVSALSRLCMHYAVAGEWEAASRSALQAIAERAEAALDWLDFCWHYETEARSEEHTS